MLNERRPLRRAEGANKTKREDVSQKSAQNPPSRPPDVPVEEFCADPITATACYFDEDTLDGEVDPGFYYVQGGRFTYDAFSFQVGAKFTF